MVIVFSFVRRYSIRLVLKIHTIICNVLAQTRKIGISLKLYDPLKSYLYSYLKVGIYPYEPYTSRKLQTASESNVTTHVAKTIDCPPH